MATDTKPFVEPKAKGNGHEPSCGGVACLQSYRHLGICVCICICTSAYFTKTQRERKRKDSFTVRTGLRSYARGDSGKGRNVCASRFRHLCKGLYRIPPKQHCCAAQGPNESMSCVQRPHCSAIRHVPLAPPEVHLEDPLMCSAMRLTAKLSVPGATACCIFV